MNRHIINAAALCLTLLGSCSMAHAQSDSGNDPLLILNPSTSKGYNRDLPLESFGFNYTVPGGTQLPGALIQGSFTSGLMTGTYSEAVYTNASTKTLDFWYQFTNKSPNTSTDPAKPDTTYAVTQFGATGFAGLNLVAGYTYTSIGAGFSTSDDLAVSGNSPFSAIPRDAGSNVTFGYIYNPVAPSGIPKRANSVTMLIRTNATAYTTSSNALSFVGNIGTATASGFVPSAASPEPGTLALLVPGVLGLGRFLLRRKRK